MRPGNNAELIFEGLTEARIVTQALIDTGNEDLLSTFDPPVETPTISRLDFLVAMSQRSKEAPGNASQDTSDFVISDLEITPRVLKALVGFAKPYPGEGVPGSRPRYIGQMLSRFLAKVEDAKPKEVQVGPFTVIGASDEQADFLQRRAAFVQQYLDEKGWDANDLSIDQLLEVRSQAGWKTP
jgi:hypothetical protein